MKLIKYRLVLDVDFDPQGTSKKDLKHNLYQVVRNALDNGLFSGDTEATVETYKFSVKERRPKKQKQTHSFIDGRTGDRITTVL